MVRKGSLQPLRERIPVVAYVSFLPSVLGAEVCQPAASLASESHK